MLLSRRYANRFTSDPSETYIQVVEALRHLEEAEPGRRLGAAYATVESPLRERLWEEGGLKRSHGYPCCQRLVGHCDHRHGAGCLPPGTDHPSLWLRDGQPAVFVSQPYDLSGETVRALL